MREALIAAGLTGLMILLFLGSWRSTLIVCISIPLSILTSLCILSLLGQTINVMTLGGLALAVGILVDDATVEIENTHRNIAMRKPLIRAVLDGASQIAVPTFVATLSICIVFVPVLLLTGTARYLFTPLAMAVVFAMLASYLAVAHAGPDHDGVSCWNRRSTCIGTERTESGRRKGLFWRGHHLFNALFESAALPLHRAARLVAAASRTSAGRVHDVSRRRRSAWPGWSGEDFFPDVDSGQMRLHARGPAGTRIEETELRFAALEARNPRPSFPPDEIDMLIDNIGIPNSWPASPRETSPPSPAPTARF